jgi:hypothetical protein
VDSGFTFVPLMFATVLQIVCLVSGVSLLQSVKAQSATPSPSSYGVCKGNNVPFRFNNRPTFIVGVASGSTGTKVSLELRLCIGSATSVANVGLKSLTLDVSNDGEWPLALFSDCLREILTYG